MRDRIAAATPWLLVGGAAGLGLLAAAVGGGLTDPFDAAVINVVRHPALAEPLAWMRALTELGSTWAITAGAIAAALIGLLMRRPTMGAAATLTIAIGAFANAQLKLTFARARPDLLDPIIAERGFSFPSGHALNSAIAYGVIAVLVSRSRLPGPVRSAVGVAGAIVILLIGVSRVYLGVHYPTDVLAGWLVGLLVVLLYAAITRAAPMARAAGEAGEDRAAPRSDPPGLR